MASLEGLIGNYTNNVYEGLQSSFNGSIGEIASQGEGIFNTYLSAQTGLAFNGVAGMLLGDQNALNKYDNAIGDLYSSTLSSAEFAIKTAIPPEIRKTLNISITRGSVLNGTDYTTERGHKRYVDTVYRPTQNIEFMSNNKKPTTIRMWSIDNGVVADSKSVNWSETSIPGRYEPIVTYESSNARSFTITGALFIDKTDDIQYTIETLSAIRAMAYPVATEAGSAIVSPPYWSVRVMTPGKTVGTYIKQARVNSYDITGVGPRLKCGMHAVYKIIIEVSEVVAELNRSGFYDFTARDFNSVKNGAGSLESEVSYSVST